MLSSESMGNLFAPLVTQVHVNPESEPIRGAIIHVRFESDPPSLIVVEDPDLYGDMTEAARTDHRLAYLMKQHTLYGWGLERFGLTTIPIDEVPDSALGDLALLRRFHAQFPSTTYFLPHDG